MKPVIFLFSIMLLSLFTETPMAIPKVQHETVEYLKPKLNSERIEYFFRNYGIEQLDINSHDFSGSRISNLYSVHQGKKIMRTLAIVDFNKSISPEMYSVHQEIIKGKSIGATLLEHGWQVTKTPIYFGEIKISPELMDWMDEKHINRSVIHAYKLNASKTASKAITYCTIIEIHSPQYLTTEWMKELYKDQYREFSVTSDEAASMLSRLSILLNEFPFTINYQRPKGLISKRLG